jgi:hypothetical protein
VSRNRYLILEGLQFAAMVGAGYIISQLLRFGVPDVTIPCVSLAILGCLAMHRVLEKSWTDVAR